jgi:hypothetical protein
MQYAQIIPLSDITAWNTDSAKVQGLYTSPCVPYDAILFTFLLLLS